MICEGYKKIACWSIALAGFTALISLVHNKPYTMITLGAGLLALGLTLLTIRRETIAITVALLALIGTAASHIDATAGIIITLAAGLVAVIAGSPGGVLMTGLAYAIAETAGHPSTPGLAALTIASSGIIAYTYTARLHSIAMSLAAVIPLAAPGYAHIMTASVLAVLLGTGRIVEVSGCPFRVENRLVLAGLAITGVGTIVIAVLGEASAWALAYWLLGFNMLIAGALVPVTNAS